MKKIDIEPPDDVPAMGAKPSVIEGQPPHQVGAWRALIIDQDPQVRQFFADCLRGHVAFTVLGEADSVASAMQCLNGLTVSPDVLLSSLCLPDGSGLWVMTEALSRFPQCDCLVIAHSADADEVLDGVGVGAVGCVLGTASPSEVVAAVLDAKAGGCPMPPLLARKMLAAYRQVYAAAAGMPVRVRPVQAAEQGGGLELSPREQAVLGMLARGFSYREIADLLNISLHTIQSHIKNLYRKLAVHSRSEAVFEATRLGLLRLDE